MEPAVLSASGILCDFAEISGGKLFISGAGITVMITQNPEPPHPVTLSLAVLVRIPWTATNQQHRFGDLAHVRAPERGWSRVGALRRSATSANPAT